MTTLDETNDEKILEDTYLQSYQVAHNIAYETLCN